MNSKQNAPPQTPSPLVELSDLIEALPADYRAPIVRAALQLYPSGTFEQSALVGLYRARLFDCVAERLGQIDLVHWEHVVYDGRQHIDHVIAGFEIAGSVEEVQVVLNDLLRLLSDAFRSEQCHDSRQ